MCSACVGQADLTPADPDATRVEGQFTQEGVSLYYDAQKSEESVQLELRAEDGRVLVKAVRSGDRSVSSLLEGSLVVAGPAELLDARQSLSEDELSRLAEISGAASRRAPRARRGEGPGRVKKGPGAGPPGRRPGPAVGRPPPCTGAQGLAKITNRPPGPRQASSSHEVAESASWGDKAVALGGRGAPSWARPARGRPGARGHRAPAGRPRRRASNVTE
ncbi:hypothetical protein [Sorangium sp. So ce124]|uniref:hypothetical protein n=1 Tax=Sorangium sp. So ce124 TaxID=3133280 RepID=UPI003F60CD99